MMRNYNPIWAGPDMGPKEDGQEAEPIGRMPD